MEGDDTQGAAAPNTRVVNLSIGDPARQLGAVMSPTARLLDYLAYKYNILFIISAGNHAEITGLVKETFHDLKSLDIAQRSKVFGTMIKDNQRNLRVLAPADSLNGLTIGALYDDFTDPKAIDLLSRPTYFIMAAGPLFGRRLTVKLIGCTHPVSLDACLRPHTGQGTLMDARIHLEQAMPLPK